MTVIVYPDVAALARGTAARLLTDIQDSLAVRGIAHVVLTGGRTGTAVLRAMAASPLLDDLDWTSVHVWWGDERFVAAGDSERNEGQAQGALLSHVALLPEENIHRIAAAGGAQTAEGAAGAYAADLHRFGDPTPIFDVTLLGVGEDGHVASLFPGHPSAGGSGPTIVVDDSPKPPATRISLSATALARSRQVWMLAAGQEKGHAVAMGIAGNSEVPAGIVRGLERTLWLVDADAATAV